MLTKKLLGYVALLVGIFCSFIFIAAESEESIKLQYLEKKIKNEIYFNMQEYKKNLYEIEKQKIEQNTNSSKIDA